MAQGGETITYTFSDGTSVAEDVSGIDEVTVNYADGSGGGGTQNANGGPGGRVEDAKIDVSSFNTLYIWVADYVGRYDGGDGTDSPAGGGSTEISFFNTTDSDSSDEPFLVAAGGGGGSGGRLTENAGSGGARGGSGFADGQGVAPPAGGTGGSIDSDGTGGDGAVDDQNRGYIVDGGTTVKGGGSGPGKEGEIRITYKSGVEKIGTTELAVGGSTVSAPVYAPADLTDSWLQVELSDGTVGALEVTTDLTQSDIRVEKDGTVYAVKTE